MIKKKRTFQTVVLSWLIIGLIAGCTVAPQIQPQVQVAVKEEPILNEEWFQTEVIPEEQRLEVKPMNMRGIIWTCFSPASSKALAIENKELRRKIELMNTRMAILYKRYFHKDHPTWKLPDTTK